MKKTLLVLIICAISTITTYSQSKLWTKVSEDKMILLEKFERANMPFQYELFNVNFSAMKALLSKAPLDSEGKTSNLVIDFLIIMGNYQNTQYTKLQ